MEGKFKVRGKSLMISVGDNPPKVPPRRLRSKNEMNKYMVTVIIFLMLISISLSQFLCYGQLIEPEVDHLGSDIFTTTWTFENASYFNATETTIAYGEVILQSYNYCWNQTSKKDFERGIKNDVTLVQQSIIEPVWSDDFESGVGDWEHGEWGGEKDEWEHGSVSEVPEFIGTHDSGTKLWGTILSGKYDDSGGLYSDYYLKSPNIDLSDYENIELSFWHYYDFENDTVFNDGGIIEISVDNGLNWEQIFPKTGYNGKIKDNDNPLYPAFCFAGNSTEWVQAQFDLSPYRESQNFSFRFRFATNGQISDYGWYIDDILITSATFSDGEVELSTRDMQIGGISNLIQRPSLVTYIDINNPANVDGLLTEWIVYIASNTTPAKGRMKIFRKEGDEFRFINQTKLEDIKQGYNEFDCQIEVKAGDYIGWYGENAEIFAEAVGSAHSMSGDINYTLSISDWTLINYSLSIKAVGISRYPSGILTSQVFDAGSAAIWGDISWGEDLSPAGVVDIVLQNRTGNSDTPDSSWNPWSSQVLDSSGDLINSPDSRYIQFQTILTTAQQPYTPTLFNVTISYTKYSPYGEVETDDFIPDFDEDLKPDVVVQWQEFFVSESLNEQDINYHYSLDSGINWYPIPENGNLSYASVLDGRIRFRATLSTADTSVSPVLEEMSLNYSSARPDMGLSIDADKKNAKPGETISITIYYDNTGTGHARNVFITLKLDENLSFKRDYSGVIPTKEEGNAIKWRFYTVEPINRLFIVETKVKDIDKETTISTYAILNYTDIGGNRYEGVISNEITIKVKISQDLLPYYLLIGAIIAIIIISFMLVVTHRFRAKQKAEEKIALKDVERGIGYLLMEENPTKSYTLFSDLIDQGYEGVCITRTFPGRVLTNYYFEGVSLLWLSRARDENSILPTNLGAVLRNVKDFMDQNENAVVLLDGLEYLIVHNDFQRVLKLVHGLNELAAINDAVLIMPLNPLTLDEGKVALLKRDLKVIG